jgi:hypothetical protein
VVPVFIGGCDRSGTTFLASLLGGTDEAIVTPESQFKIDALQRPKELGNSAFLWRLDMWGISKAQALAAVEDAEDGTDLMERFLHQYMQGIGSKGEPSFWIDHTPANLRFFTDLSHYYPAAKFIHIIRDGRAIAASILPLEWGPSTIADVSKWWLEKLSFGLAAQRSFPDKVITVKYEDLVSNTECELRRICQFLDLRFCESMLGGNGFKVPKYTAHQHQLVGKKPDSNVSNKWKTALSSREIQIFEAMAGGMLSMLGYETLFKNPKPATKTERLLMKFKTGHLFHITRRLKRRARITTQKPEAR